MADEEEAGNEERWSTESELSDDVLRLLVSELRAQNLTDRHEARA
ncbi:MAG: hypothetical protein M0Z33_01370 [Actinomycetota bacterium]|nr:hypothetical protein [Actinomycetota bacterium]